MHAYDASFQLCNIALRVSGYAVSKGKSHHSFTIGSLEYTLGQEQSENTIYLSKCSTQRHHSLYDHAGVVSEQDAQDLLETARQLRLEVLKWLHADHPNVLPKGYSQTTQAGTSDS